MDGVKKNLSFVVNIKKDLMNIHNDEKVLREDLSFLYS